MQVSFLFSSIVYLSPIKCIILIKNLNYLAISIPIVSILPNITTKDKTKTIREIQNKKLVMTWDARLSSYYSVGWLILTGLFMQWVDSSSSSIGFYGNPRMILKNALISARRFFLIKNIKCVLNHKIRSWQPNSYHENEKAQNLRFCLKTNFMNFEWEWETEWKSTRGVAAKKWWWQYKLNAILMARNYYDVLNCLYVKWVILLAAASLLARAPRSSISSLDLTHQLG